MDYENVIKRGSDAELTFRRHEALLKSVSMIRGLRQVFKGLGGTGIWNAGETFLTGGPWNVTIMVRGFSTRSFWTTDTFLLEGFRCSISGYVPVFGSMVGGDFGFGFSWMSKFSPLCLLWLHNLWFLPVVSEKQLSVSVFLKTR